MINATQTRLLALAVVALALASTRAEAQCFAGGTFTCNESSSSTTNPVLFVTSTASSYAFSAIDIEQTGGGNALVGTASGTGSDAIGVAGTTYGSGGIAVSGAATDTTAAATNYGVHGTSAGTNSYGVYGYNGAAHSTAQGVYGYSAGGSGVFGSGGTAGVIGKATSSTGWAVEAVSYQSSTSNPGLSVNGTTDLQGQVTVTGSGTYTGTWQMSSDARLKKNVVQLRGNLSRLLALRGVAYEWKEPEKHGGLVGQRDGFIAQEVEKVFPEWVGVDRQGYKTIATGAPFAGVCVEALREMNSQENDLEGRISALEAGMDAVDGRPHERSAAVLSPTPGGLFGTALIVVPALALSLVGRLRSRRQGL